MTQAGPPPGNAVRLGTAVPDHAGDPVGAASVWNIANALTVFRVACVPLLAWLLWLDASGSGTTRVAATLVFVLAAITDLVDGVVARRFGLITTFGKIADPIADKALTGVALVGLSAIGGLAWWVTIVILAREIAVTVLRFWVIDHGVIPASRGGKAKTVAQIVAISMYLADLPFGWWPVACACAMAIAVVLTLATGVDYVVRAVRLRRRIAVDDASAGSHV